MDETTDQYDVRKLRGGRSHWVGAAISVLISIALTVVGWAWAAGGYSQRIAINEQQSQRFETHLETIQTQVNAQQAQSAAMAAQYVEINRRLNSIDDHLDRLEHK